MAKFHSFLWLSSIPVCLFFNRDLYPKECGYIWGSSGAGGGNQFKSSFLPFISGSDHSLRERTGGIIHGWDMAARESEGLWEFLRLPPFPLPLWHYEHRNKLNIWELQIPTWLLPSLLPLPGLWKDRKMVRLETWVPGSAPPWLCCPRNTISISGPLFTHL